MRCASPDSYEDLLSGLEKNTVTRPAPAAEPMTQVREIDTPTWTTFDLSAALADTGETLPSQVPGNSTTNKPKEWLPLQNDRAQAAHHALKERRSWAGTSITDDGAPRNSPPLRKGRRASTTLPSPLLPLPDASDPPIRRASTLLASANQKTAPARPPASQPNVVHENHRQTRHPSHPSHEESYRYATCIVNALNDLEKSLVRVSKGLRYVCVNIRTDSDSLICPDDPHPVDDEAITALEVTTESDPKGQSAMVNDDGTGKDARDTNKDNVDTCTSFRDFVYSLSKRVLADVVVLNRIFRRRTNPILNPILDAFRQCGAFIPSDSADLQTLSEIADRMLGNPEHAKHDPPLLPSSTTNRAANSTNTASFVRNSQHTRPIHDRLIKACESEIDRNLYPRFHNENDLDLIDYDLSGCYLSQEETIDFWNKEKPALPRSSSAAPSSPDHSPPFAVDLAFVREPFDNTGSSVGSQVPSPLPRFRLSKQMTPPISGKQPKPSVDPVPSSPPKPKTSMDQTTYRTRLISPMFPQRSAPHGNSPLVPRKQQPITVIQDSSDDDKIRPAAERPKHSTSLRLGLTRNQELPKNGRSPLPPHARSPEQRLPPNRIRSTRTMGPQIPQSSRLPRHRFQISRLAGGPDALPSSSSRDYRPRDAAPHFKRTLPGGAPLLHTREEPSYGRGRKRRWQPVHHDGFERTPLRGPGPSRVGKDTLVGQARTFRLGDSRRRDFNSFRAPSSQTPTFRYRSQNGTNDPVERGPYSRSSVPLPRSFEEFPQRHAPAFSDPFIPIPRFPQRRPTRPSESDGSPPRRETPIVELD